jgi:hypothetical protein
MSENGNGNSLKWNQLAVWLLTGFAFLIVAIGGYVINKVDALEVKKLDAARYECDIKDLKGTIEKMDTKLDRVLMHQNGKRDRQ